MSAHRSAVAAWLWALVACTGADRPGGAPWHEAPPPLAVSVPGATEVRRAPVEVVAAPEIRFTGLVVPDPNHVSAVVAPDSGTVSHIEDEGRARRGRVLAEITRTDGRSSRAVVAGRDGAWRPRRRPGQIVWPNDTMGVIEEHGFMLAVGAVSDVESGAIHRGDPASVVLADAAGPARPGRVEWVRRPGTSYRYSAEVAVEFRVPEVPASGRTDLAGVVVRPSDPQDSLPAVPAAAVVHLSPGPAVFVPAGNDVFQLRWVSTGPTVGGLVTVRDGLERDTLVVASGLSRLAAAARDSLARRRR